jgi:hypothetical protein
VVVVERLDRFQRKHSWLGFPLAVVYKFADDRGPYLAALVTYYGFVSLFPLLLLFLSALGIFLEANPHLRNELVQSALKEFPVIGPQLQRNIGGFRGTGTRLVFSVLGALYGGLGAMQATQAGFNHIYGVPRNEQPNPALSRLRSLGLLLMLGGAVFLSTTVATLVATASTLVGLEPSCLTVFRDELVNLFPGDARAQRLHAQSFTLAEFLDRHAPDWPVPRLHRDALVQPHCHHHSVLGFGPDQALLARMGLRAAVPDAGCCGMAGSFGYEAGEKYRVSMAAGERALLPAVRGRPTTR